MRPKVSVIIPTFNRQNTIERAINSVLNQSFKDFELIVVDDGSTDRTSELLKSIPDLILIKQTNQGVSKARNVGISKSGAELIAFLDSDDEWLPEKLEWQVEFFDKNPDAMICQTEEIWIRNGKRVNPMKKHKKYSSWIFKECLPLCVVSPSAVMMRQKLFDCVGLFDESLPACEDYDLWLRIAARFPIYLIDEPLVVKYGGHSDQLSRTIPNLDRYRIKSLKKILESGILTEEQRNLAYKELARKSKIYGNGCLKRGKNEEGEKILKLVK